LEADESVRSLSSWRDQQHRGCRPILAGPDTHPEPCAWSAWAQERVPSPVSLREASLCSAWHTSVHLADVVWGAGRGNQRQQETWRAPGRWEPTVGPPWHH